MVLPEAASPFLNLSPSLIVVVKLPGLRDYQCWQYSGLHFIFFLNCGVFVFSIFVAPLQLCDF